MVDEQSQHDSTLNERDFLIEINSRMQVPDRIYAQPNSNREFFMAQDDDEEEETRHDKSVKSKNSPVSKMYLPDTIVMSDDNKYHKGIRLNSLEDDDFGLLEDRFNRVVTTIAPAETLTFGQHRNRNDSFIHKQEKDVDFFDEDFEAEGLINFGMESSHLGNQTFAELSVMSTSDVNILPLIKKQVRFLNRRVVQLEKENQARRQREFVLYTLGLVYFAFKGFGLMRKFL